MINGAHILLYSKKPEVDRAFFHDVLGFRSVDAGGGWLIFALPPSEVAVHPAEDDDEGPAHAGHRLLEAAFYLMCDDLTATVALLESKKVRCTEIQQEPWGIRTTVRLPSGGEIGLYQPTHPTAIGPGSGETD